MPHAATHQREQCSTSAPRLGAGPLHDALVASEAAAHLARFAKSIGCDPLELSSDGGKTMDVERMADVMRRRGYQIGEPVRPQTQLDPRVTVWTVQMALPCGITFLIAYTRPNPPEQHSISTRTKRSNS